MRAYERRNGLTLVEVLLLIGLCISIIALLLPAIQSAREMARRSTCLNNMKRIGLAFYKYHDLQRQFPPSSEVTRNASGQITAVDGWSWAVLVLPYEMEIADGRKDLYERLDLANGRPLIERTSYDGTPHADALATRLPKLLCPSFAGSPFADPEEREAITNYKTVGATHIESLSIASAQPLTPKYDPTVTAQGIAIPPAPAAPRRSLLPGNRCTVIGF